MSDSDTPDNVTSDLTPPKTSAGDYLYAGAKGGIGVIPFVGPPIAELASLVIKSPLQKRSENWQNHVAEVLVKLVENDNNFVERIKNDENLKNHFTALSINAMKTSKTEKINAFKNILSNIDSSIDDDIKELFIRWIDELSVTHLKLLKWSERPKSSYSSGKGEFGMGSIYIVLLNGFHDYSSREYEYNAIISELYQRSLINFNADAIKSSTTMSQALSPKITSLGLKFLEFISGDYEVF